MLKKYILIMLIISSIIIINAEMFSVIKQTEDEVQVKFTLPDYEVTEVNINEEIFHKVSCPNSAYLEKQGFPMLPFFAEAIGLPIDGSLEIQVIKKKQIVAKDLNILPVEAISANNDGLEYNFFKDSAAYRKANYYPENLLKKGDKAYIGDRFFSSIRIYPFQYITSTKKLLVTTEVTFRITITGDKKISRNWQQSSNYIDKVADSIFLNNDVSQKWRKSKEKAKYFPPREGDEINEIQIIVDEEGIYKITYNQLIESVNLFIEEHEIENDLAINLDNIDPRYLELRDENGTIPIHFEGDVDGSFDSGDYFEFFGDRHYGDESYYDDYTAENVYSLRLADHLGSRMAVEDGGLQVSDTNEFESPTSYEQTLHFEKQDIYNTLGLQWYYNGRAGNNHPGSFYYKEDKRFWDKISTPELKIIPFELEYPLPGGFNKKFSAKVNLFGLSYKRYPGNNQVNLEIMDHHSIVRINSALIDNIEWNGQREQEFSSYNSINNNKLNHGTNNLIISLPGTYDEWDNNNFIETEQTLLDYLEITYWREYKTDSNYLKFTKPSDESEGLFQFDLTNFSSDSVSVYKINSCIFEHIQIEPYNETAITSYNVSFQDEVLSQNSEYIAVAESQKKIPVQIRPNLPSNLKNQTNRANLIIVTIEDFINAEGTLLLKELWEEQGNEVEIVSTQDIYDEFNHGIRSAEAIKDFFRYSYNNWTSPQLEHVILLGDGIDDERDKRINRAYNLIPVRHIWADVRGSIASDSWYSCIIGDDPVSDINVSRINIWEEDQILDVALKSQSYVENPNFNDMWHGRMILAAGGNEGEGSYFANQCENLLNKNIDSDFHIKRIYCNTTGLPNDYLGGTSQLIQGIDDGVLYLSFMGHGGGYVWADYNLLRKADIQTFNNDNLPFVTSLSCFGSAFNSKQSSCIGEELIITPRTGSIAHLGFTGFGYAQSDETFHDFLLDAIYIKKIGNIGKITDYAKTKLYIIKGNSSSGIALTDGCALLGDGMINMLVPDTDHNITLEKYNLSVGDTLSCSSDFDSDYIRGRYTIYNENDVQLPLNEYYPQSHFINNGNITVSDFIIPPDGNSIYTGTVKLAAYSSDKEVIGSVNYTIGQTAVANISIIPEIPTENDSIHIMADFFDEDEIDRVLLCIGNFEYISEHIPMIDINDDGITYKTKTAISPHPNGSKITYFFVVLDNEGNRTETELNTIIIAGPDLILRNYELVNYNNTPAFKVVIENIGNTDSPPCDIKLYNLPDTIACAINSINPISFGERRTEYLQFGLLRGYLTFKIVINENQESFSEPYYNSNLGNYINITEPIEMNWFIAGITDISANSWGSNVTCDFPAELLDSEKVFFIHRQDKKEALNQPGIQEIDFHGHFSSPVYEINCLDSSIFIDSLGTLPDNKKIKIEFHYEHNQEMESNENFAVYRWINTYKKWIYMGGAMDTSSNKVTYYSNKLGTFALFARNDLTPPTISLNVEGQEFSTEYFDENLNDDDEFHGGYVSRNGTISIQLNDSDGIDVIDNNITIKLDHELVSDTDYSINYSVGNMESIPIKYQLRNLANGNHVIEIQCTDVNGNFGSSGLINLKVHSDFDVINFANYPNPVVTKTLYEENEAKTRFTYVLTDDADDVRIKIYTVSGRLVKTFKDLPTTASYHEFPREIDGWDCRDEKGFFLANGVYFYKIIAKKGNLTIEKSQKMAIIK